MNPSLVLVLYESQRIDTVLQIMARLHKQVGFASTVVVRNSPRIDQTALESRLRAWPGSIEIRDHDNTGMEFGAYQAGWAQLSTASRQGVLYVNDTIGTNQYISRFYRARLAGLLTTAPTASAFACGHVILHPHRLAIGDLESASFIRSNLFFLNQQAMQALDEQIYRPDIDQLVRVTTDENSFFAPEVGAGLARHLRNWLFNTHHTSGWYKAQALNESNAGFMASKARSILQEKLLSLRLYHKDVVVQPIDLYGWRQCLHHYAERRWEQKQASQKTRPSQQDSR